MSQPKSMTSPLAIIKIGTKTIGRMKNIRVTESFRRGDVRGLGELISQEKPILGIDCTLSCSYFLIDLKQAGIADAVKRDVGTVQNFVNTVLFNEQGIDIYIYKKEAATIDPQTGVVLSTNEADFAVIKGAFPESQNFDISEGSIAGSDCTFTYLEPILYPAN